MISFKMNSFKISKNYYLDEFQCKCCNTVKIANRLIDLLEEATRQVGKKLEISSAYRCEKHNKEVGGVENSYHTQGLALDIIVPQNQDIEAFASLLERIGFRGIGIYYNKNFVHVDLGTKRRWKE